MTAQDLIQYAAKELEVIASGETLSTDELTDGLFKLNALLAAWSCEQLSIFARTSATHVCVGGQGSYTLGPGGDFNVTRPFKITAASVITSEAISDPLRLISQEEYEAIPEKTMQSVLPRTLYNDWASPLANLYLHPIPSGTPTLELSMWGPLQQFATIGDTVTLPTNYTLAIVFNLAVDLGPQFGREPSATVATRAQQYKAAIQQLNQSNQAAAPNEIPVPAPRVPPSADTLTPTL